MNMGILTVLVAVAFGALGIMMGLTLCRLSGKKETEETTSFKELEEEIKKTAYGVDGFLAELRRKINELTEKTIEDMRTGVKSLYNELEKLYRDTGNINITDESRRALESSLENLKNFEVALPSIDQTILTRIRDNLLIVRNDVQSLLLAREQETAKTPAFDFSSILASLDSAIELARNLNLHLVKDELVVMANSIRQEDRQELLKSIDREALASKELVVLLSGIKKELEGVGK